jgi:hypothetical protein
MPVRLAEGDFSTLFRHCDENYQAVNSVLRARALRNLLTRNGN